MSTSKVIFTYKRKRLSSCSGVGHADVCADFSVDVEVDKHQDAPNEEVRSSEKDLRHVCLGEEMPAMCSSPGDYNSSILGEKCDVQISDKTNSRKMILGSHELPGDNTCKTSSGNVSSGASLGETTNSIEKDSCLRNSSYPNIEGRMQGGSVSQSVEKDSIILNKQSYLSKTEAAKGKSSAPLRTFSRRLKRKADACDAGEVASKESRLVEKSLDIKAESSDADMRSMRCQSSEKMTSNGIRASSCPCERSSTETLIMKQTEKTSNSQEDVVVDTSSVTKSTAIRTSGSIASAFQYPDSVGSSSLQKDDVRCSSYDGTVISSCNVAYKMDEQPVSHQRGASSGDSQLTSSDSSDLKIADAKRVEHRGHSNSLDLSRPPPGAFVIDCNVIPEFDVQEDASDIIQDSLTVKSREKVMQEGNMKSKGFELFGDNSVLVQDSSDGVHTLKKTETKPKTKCLQLFSEDGKCSQFNPSNTHSEIGHSKTQQNVAVVLDSQRHQLEQSSSKASTVRGSSLHTEPINEGQPSKDGPTIHLFQNSNVRTCDLIQNPVVQSFPDQASLRHKLLLEGINTKATSLRGNRNISLDKFEPCPAMWSEEELDSLWIGMRRHGRGNWHAMLLDPRLRFAPWRTVGDLEDQWGREQYKLFSGQHMPSSRYLKPQDSYKLHCNGPVICHGTGGRRETVAAETQLSLGDVYAQKDAVFSRGIDQSYGISQAQRHVTMASGVGSYACGLFNNVQASVMIRSEVSSDGPAVAFGMNNCLPHWLRDTISTPLRPLDPHIPPISTLSQMGGLRFVQAFPETTGTCCKGKSLVKPAVLPRSSSLQCGNPLTRKPGLANNLIVIDSDASSEETISDDNNIGVN